MWGDNMGITYGIKVSGYDEVESRLKSIGNLTASQKNQCLMDAMSHTVRTDILKRTPMSAKTNPIYCDASGKVLPEYEGKIGKMNLRHDFAISTRQSGTSRSEVTLGFHAQGMVGYTGVDYADEVHSRTQAGVRWTTPGTGALFLSKPVEEGYSSLMKEYYTNIDLMLKSGGII